MNVIELRDALTKLVEQGNGQRPVYRYTEEIHHSQNTQSYIVAHMWKEVREGKLDDDALKLF